MHSSPSTSIKKNFLAKEYKQKEGDGFIEVFAPISSLI